MLEKWKAKSIFGKLSDILFFVILIGLLTPQGRLAIGGFVNRITAQIRNPSTIDGAQLTQNDINWNLQDLEGNAVNVASYKRKVLFINLWATWCPPCVGEMPEIEALYQKYKDNPDIAFLMISNEDIPKIKKFITKRGFSFPVFSSRSQTPAVFASKGIPTTFLVSKAGKIVIKETGAMNWAGSKMYGVVDGLLDE